MKIAIASQNRREITGHTGHCRRFWIYDIGSDGEIAVRFARHRLNAKGVAV